MILKDQIKQLKMFWIFAENPVTKNLSCKNCNRKACTFSKKDYGQGFLLEILRIFLEIYAERSTVVQLPAAAGSKSYFTFWRETYSTNMTLKNRSSKSYWNEMFSKFSSLNCKVNFAKLLQKLLLAHTDLQKTSHANSLFSRNQKNWYIMTIHSLLFMKLTAISMQLLLNN